MENVRVYEIPQCKMVTSGLGWIGDVSIEKFSKWLDSLPKTIFPKDFLWFDDVHNGFVWNYIYDSKLDMPDDFGIIDFSGGLYAVASGIDGESNQTTIDAIRQFIKESKCFVEDTNRKQLGNIITPKSAQKAMGYLQMDYYIPIKIISIN